MHMNKVGKIVLGLALIAVGVIFGLNAAGLTDINVFFDGWWTLFIIVPCAVGLVTEREKTGNLIGIAIGVVLLLWRQGIVDLELVWKLLLPAVIVIIGVRLIVKAFSGDKSKVILTNMYTQGRAPRVVCAVFSGNDVNFDSQPFEGAELTAVFGGIECDLRTALFQQDCAIKVCSVFGGIDILVPDDVQVKVNTLSLFGGVSNKSRGNKNAPVTIYLTGTCLFGGVDIK